MNDFNENKTVGRLSELLALKRGYDPAKAKQLKTAAVLHDIGKAGVPASILNKPDKLTTQEFEIMKTHTKLGVEMLASVQGDLGDLAKMICLFHHEWHNPLFGGYWGVSTYFLPDYISIVSVCDVFTALLERRVYKEPWPPKDAVDYIEKQAGTQFCPELVKDFILMIRDDSRVPALFAAIKTP